MYRNKVFFYNFVVSYVELIVCRQSRNFIMIKTCILMYNKSLKIK